MSVEHLASVLHHSKARGTAKLVLIGIANHAGDGGAWPAVATLAAYANCDERTVQRSIAKLVELRELRVTVQGGGTPTAADWSRPNRYDVLVACPPSCDRTPQHRDTRKATQRALLNPVDNRVTPVSPGTSDQADRVTPVSPGGVTPVSPEPPYEPSHDSATAQATDRARRVRPGCMPGCVIDQDNHDGVCRTTSEPPHDAIEALKDKLAAAGAKHHQREREVDQ